MSIIHLSSHPDTVRWGTLPARGDRPVAAINAGDTLRIDTLSHEGLLEEQGKDPLGFFRAQGVAASDILADAAAIAAESDHPHGSGPHVVNGPVEVRGAKPGDWLAIDILRLSPRVDYGIISNRHGKGVLPSMPEAGRRTVSIFARRMRVNGKDVGVMRKTGPDAIDAYHTYLASGAPASPPEPDDPDTVAFPLCPFLGIIGVTPDTGEHLSTVPPGDFGGNLDINLMVEGTRLYLPVFVDGAGLYAGDPHFAQGDGEVALTALEASLEADLRVGVIAGPDFTRRFGVLQGPLLETPDYLVTTGRALRLDDALEHCVEESLRLLVDGCGFDRAHAYAYLSAAADFDISEAVDIQRGVHAAIRRADIGR